MDHVEEGERDDAAPRRAPPEFGFDAPGEPWVGRVHEAMRSPLSGRAGAYVIDSVVSHGGQGVVYRGRHAESGRPVALKCLRAGALADAEALARFGREVRLTSGLRHPGIVEVYGVEMLEGQPVIAMEWIDGDTVTRWAQPQAGRRAVDEILQVAVAVCDAVQHAHQRGVLHRDLKPSNVLVDTAGQPKVVDFGVAKQFDAADGEDLTLSGEFVGTLAYAAPEQIRSGARALDVRSDVFAIGLIVYEMLTGRRPYDVGRSMADAVHAVAAARIERPSALAPGIGYELDTIVLKALAFDPAQRYQSVDALGEDLRRLRQNRPILAHPPSTWYLIRKLVAQHRWPFLLLASSSILLVAMAIVTLLQARTIVQTERREAQARGLATSMTAYLTELFRDLSPHASGKRATLSALIERAVQRIDNHVAADSPIRAELRETIGSMLADLASFDLAVAVLRDALRIRADLGDLGGPGEAKARSRLGIALQGSGQYAEAEEQLSLALRLYHSDPQGRRTEIRAVLLSLARVEQAKGRYDVAVALLEEVLYEPAAERGQPTDRAAALLVLSELQQVRGDYAAAAAAAASALAIRREFFGGDHPAVAQALAMLASATESMGDIQGADCAYQEALCIYEEALGSEHPSTAHILTQVGGLRVLQGRIDEGLDCFARATDVLTRVPGSDPVGVATALQGRAVVLIQTRGLDEAERILQDSLAMLRRSRGGAQLATATVMGNLASVLAERGRRAVDRSHPTLNDDLRAARSLLVEANEIRRQVPGPRHFDMAQGVNGLGAIASYVRDHDTAEAHYQEALRLLHEGSLDAHPNVVPLWTNLAAVARDRQRDRARAQPAEAPDFTPAIARFQDARAVADRIGLPAFHPERVYLLHQLGTLLIEAGRASEAEATLAEIAAADRGDRADREGYADAAQEWLVKVLLDRRDDQAALARLQFLYAKLQRFAENSFLSADRLHPLFVKLYELKGDTAQAEHWRRMPTKAQGR